MSVEGGIQNLFSPVSQEDYGAAQKKALKAANDTIGRSVEASTVIRKSHLFGLIKTEKEVDDVTDMDADAWKGASIVTEITDKKGRAVGELSSLSSSANKARFKIDDGAETTSLSTFERIANVLSEDASSSSLFGTLFSANDNDKGRLSSEFETVSLSKMLSAIAATSHSKDAPANDYNPFESILASSRATASDMNASSGGILSIGSASSAFDIFFGGDEKESAFDALIGLIKPDFSAAASDHSGSVAVTGRGVATGQEAVTFDLEGLGVRSDVVKIRRADLESLIRKVMDGISEHESRAHKVESSSFDIAI